jgi:hypothetical protein
MQRIMQTCLYSFWVFFVISILSYCPLILAVDVTSADPIYCHQGECLYCDESGCIVVPIDVDKPSIDVSQPSSDSTVKTATSNGNEKIAALNGKLHEKLKELTPRAKEASRQYAAKLNKEAHTTYETLKNKNHQMKVNRIVTQRPTKKVSPRDYIVAVNNGTHKVMSNLHARKPIKSEPPKVVAKPVKSPARTNARINKKRQKQVIQSLPEISPSIEPINLMPEIFYYKPTIDFAQYALHQGNSRSANLAEGFIPLGKFTFERVLFLDLRYYNPNGTPYEWSADLAFRQLPLGDFLWGIYTGYDRFRSDTTRYFSQINAGLEFWFYRLFFGANVYIPVGTKEYDNIHEGASLVPTSISYRYNIAYEDEHDERALPGGDAELGWDITHGLTVYGGGYYFHHAGFSTVAGPKLRATYTFYRSTAHRLLWLFDRIRLEGSITHDKPRGTSWLFGIRFTLGLAKQPNPTVGIIRHMADPIRRDINGISEAFNTEDLLRDSSGNVINVDIPNGTDLTIDAAIADETSEIVGVRGTQTTSSTLDIGDHTVTITGGIYHFTVGSHVYNLQIGTNGVIKQSSGAGAALFSMDGTKDVTIEHVTLSVNGGNNTDAILIDDPSTSNLGTLTIDDVMSNGTFFVDLLSGQNATFSFSNNEFSITADETSAISLTADDGNITITKFENNGITTTGDDAPAIANQATSSSGNITYTNEVTQNDISTTGDNAVGILNQADAGDIEYSKSFNNNEVNTSGTGTDIVTSSDTSAGIFNDASNSGTVTFGGNFNQNTIETQGAYSSSIVNVSTDGGEIMYSSKFNNNALTTNGQDSIALSNYSDGSNSEIDYNGIFSGNTIKTLTNIAGTGQLTVFGVNATALFNYAINDGVIQFSKALSGNTIKTNSNSALGLASYTDSNSEIEYGGAITQNTISSGLSSSGSESSTIFNRTDDNSSIIYSVGITNNTLNAVGNDSYGLDVYARSGGGTITFLDITNNQINVDILAGIVLRGSGTINIGGAGDEDELGENNFNALVVELGSPTIVWNYSAP